MSDTSPPSTTTSTESPTVSSTQQPSSNSGIGGPGTSNLYLVTFLATLFLLLFVSCAIVLRSYILRRRYQRRLEEAMASGLLLAPRTQGSKRKRFGTKPKLHDAWLSHTGFYWKDLMPLAAQPVFVKRKFKEPPAKQPPAAVPATATSTAINPAGTPSTPLTPDIPHPELDLVTPGSDSNQTPNTSRPLNENDFASLLGRDLLSHSQEEQTAPTPGTSTTSRRTPWGWFGRRNRNDASGTRRPVHRDGEDVDADEDDYDLAPISASTSPPPPPPSLFGAAGSPVNRNASPSRTGPATLTHAYLSGGTPPSTPNTNLNVNANSNSNVGGLDAAAMRAAVAAGAVPGGSMPLGVMPVAGAPAGTYKVRVEMLQVTTLIAMPCPPGRDGKSRVRRIRGTKAFGKRAAQRMEGTRGKEIEEEDGTESDGESLDDDEEEEEKPLPELVFGVTRVNHSSNKAAQVGLVGRMKEF